MLSQQLRRFFATIGARLLVRTDPKSTATRIALKSDTRGPYFELQLPLLSRRVVAVMAIHPREGRLMLRLTQGSKRIHVLVRGGERPSVRALSPAEARSIMAGAAPSATREKAA